MLTRTKNLKVRFLRKRQRLILKLLETDLGIPKEKIEYWEDGRNGLWNLKVAVVGSSYPLLFSCSENQSDSTVSALKHFLAQKESIHSAWA